MRTHPSFIMNVPPGGTRRTASPLTAIIAEAQAPDSGNGATDRTALVELAVLQSRVAELELRLRERVEENVVLDNEVRCLQKERLVSHEYIASLQHDAARLHEVERELWETRRQLGDATSELEAFRNRVSLVLVERVVVSARRFPGIPRVGRYAAQTMIRSLKKK